MHYGEQGGERSGKADVCSTELNKEPDAETQTFLDEQIQKIREDLEELANRTYAMEKEMTFLRKRIRCWEKEEIQRDEYKQERLEERKN